MNRILDILKRSFSFFWMGVLTRAQSSPSPTNASAAPGTGIGGLSPDHSSNNGIIKTNTLQRENSDRPQDPTVSRNIPPLGARGLRGLLSLFLILLSTLPLWGQGGTFPVQVIPQALPPAPIYISSYADASTVTSPLRVQIILNDFEIANREIRLKTYFIGSGLSFQSNDIVVGASPLFLEGGIPLVLTNVELAPYFEFTNITGINANQYGNAIPEGAYQFCVEVYDVLTGSRLSNKSCAISVVFQNEPPFLVLPRNKENVDEVNPQYIVFQWTPRSINVSNVEYELSLVEIWDNQVDPQQAFLSSPPVFQTTTTATTYVYGPSDPLLLSGKNYAWRVRAKAKQGTEEIGLFKNEGYSEIYSFSYASACELPLAINHEVKGSTNANIFWDDFSTDVPEYTVRYRKASPRGGGLEGAEWFLSKTTANRLTLWDLKAGTTYEYQVSKKCSVTVSDWSFSKQFTTFIADDEESVYDCGITPDFNLTNKDPLQTIGDKFTAGDFPIKVIEASGSNGYFTGKGYVTIPYLNSIKVGVQFTNVFINTENQLVEGSVITMYDPSLKNILDIDDAIDTVTDIIDSVGEFFEGDNDVDEINVGWEIRSVDDIKIEDGQVVITNPYTGATRTEPLGDDMAITDSAGNTYYVSEDGQITKGGDTDAIGEVTNGNVEGVSNNGQVESLTAKGILVTFNKKGTYGMDAMPTGNIGDIEKEYTFIKDADGNSYELIHHAVKNQGSTQIEAKITLQNSTYAASDAIFKNKRGEIIPHTLNGNTATLTLQGRFTFENETIYAVVPNKEDNTKQLTAGAFKLWHLTERDINVVLISVGASVDNIKNTVTDIFKNSIANVNFKGTITLDPSEVNDLLGSNGMDVGDSPFTAAYNQEQKALRTLAKAKGANDSDTYYIIVLGEVFTNTKGIAGFMPLQRQFGFVFEKYVSSDNEGKGDLAKTVAHELGHGVFALQHPFSQYGSSREATNWLMSYNDSPEANHLPHMHWAQIHNPDLKFYVFQKEEEGESVDNVDPVLAQLKNLSSSSGSKHFAIKHCDECQSNPEPLDGGYISMNNLASEEKSLFDEFTILENGELVGYQVILDGSNKRCYILYFQENGASYDSSIEITDSTFNLQKGLWFINNESNEVVSCVSHITDKLSTGLCSSIIEVNNKPTFAPSENSTYLLDLFSAINSCITPGNIDISQITSILQKAKAEARNNQLIEFSQNGKIFRLNDENQATEITNAISDSDINQGNWTETDIDVIGRLSFTANGYLNFKALGIRNNIAIAEGKSAKTDELSNLMRVKANSLLSQNLVVNVSDTPNSKGINLNNGEEIFADGKKVAIDNNASYFKIIFEGGGLLTSFLKTAKIEQKTYLNSTEGKETIHGPPIVTGTLEAGAKAVTDITSVVGMVYELAVDSKVRTETWQGMKKIGVQVQDEPSSLFPILTEVVLEEVSGNTPDEWSELDNPSGDDGRKGHVVTKGAVRTVSSIFLGGKFIAKLPKMADEIVEKMLKAKLLAKLKTSANFSEELLQLFKKNLTEIIELYPNIGESIMKIADFSTADELFKIVEQMKKLKNVDGIETVIKDMSTYWTKFKGSSFQLEYFVNKLDDLGAQVSELKFEVPEALTEVIDGVEREVGRVYDATLRGVRYELKNWNNFYPQSIQNQLLRDLLNIKSLDELQWVFNKTDNIADLDVLKEKVIGALTKADGITPIDKLDDLFDSTTNLEKFKQLFGNDLNTAEDLLNKLNNDTTFDKLFEVAGPQ